MPRALWRRVKIAAMDEGCSMTQLMIVAIEAYLKTAKKAA